MYSIKVPADWEREEKGTMVSFANGLNGVRVAISKADSTPTIVSITQDQVPMIKHLGHKVQVASVKSASMPNGMHSVYVVYTADSDPVARKATRLNQVTYYYYMSGKLAAVTVWSPVGAGNVNLWKQIAGSFQWMP